MKRHLTAFAMTGALALSGIGAAAPPAQADDHGAYIAGAAALAIFGAAIANQRHRGGGHAGTGHQGGGHAGTARGGHGGGYETTGYGALPSECRVHSGQRYGYSGNCLSGSYGGYAELPAACEIYIGGRHGTVYRDSCLDRYGYDTGGYR